MTSFDNKKNNKQSQWYTCLALFIFSGDVTGLIRRKVDKRDGKESLVTEIFELVRRADTVHEILSGSVLTPC